MVDRQEFIEREILPALGEYAADFDVEGLCDAVSNWDDLNGYVLNDGLDAEGFWELVKKFEK